MLHTLLIGIVTKPIKRSIEFKDSSSGQSSCEVATQLATELPIISVSIGQLETDLFLEESPVKKTCSRYVSTYLHK